MSTGDVARGYRRQWRDYRTAAGNRPVREFIMNLPSDDRAEIAAAMARVQQHGLGQARHLRGDIYEVRAVGRSNIFRVLFAAEGRYNHILLTLDGFIKKTRKTPPARISLAEERLADWRSRASNK